MKFGSLQVHTPDGVDHNFEIDLPSVVVGRADGNAIVIDDLSISRRHARLVVESGRLLIEDLGSAAGTFIGGHRIDPGSPNLIETDEPIRFGDVVASYIPAPPSITEPELPKIEGIDGLVEDAPSAAIRVTLTSPTTPVQPGGAAFATAVIHNRGRLVDLVRLGVTGVPASWVTFSQNTLALVPGTSETVTLVFQPPIHAESLAGDYDFGLTVSSAENDREGIAFGKLIVQPFEATELLLSPVRSRKNFVLTARNNGNAFVTYALGGHDDEGAFLYDFDVPAIELQPGQERRVPVRVRRRSTQWFGKPNAQPFQVEAVPSAGATRAVQAPGQLLVLPPLERWKWPILVVLVLGLLALAFWISWLHRDELPTWVPWSTKGDATASANGNPEAAYAGVHMCDKSQEERDQASAKATPPPAGTSGAPLFAQNNPTWGKVEYAKAADPEFGPDWCGTTIEQCGCAMTSTATIMAVFGILTMPDGKELNPQTVNEWFNGEARKTARGWVSRGYIYGDVIWTAANELSGQIAKVRPGTPTVRFAGFGPGTDEDIRNELQAGRPVVLEVPGHYIAAVGLDGDKILINDPYYADRKTLDVYKGKVKGSVHFESSNNLSGVVITVPKDLRVQVKDKQGNVVGSLNADEATSPAPVGIQGAYLSSRDAWRDPTCVESPPPAGAGTTSIFLPGNKADYTIEILNPSNGGTSVAIHSYDEDGNASVETRDATGASVITLAYDPAQATPQVQVLQGVAPGSGGNGTPSGGGTPQLPSGGGTGGGNGSNTQATPNPTTGTTPSPAASPTATRTPAPTPTPVAPATVNVTCDVAYTPSPKSAGVTCTGSVSGTFTTTRWTLNGLPAPVPPGSTSFTTTFSQDTTANVEMTACNITVCKTGSASVVVKFTAPTPTPSATPVPGTPTPTPTVPPVGPPSTVTVECTWESTAPGANFSCFTDFSEAFNSITWNTTNATPAQLVTGAKTFQGQRIGQGDATVTATVCLGTTCTVSNVRTIPGSDFNPQITIIPPGNVCVGDPPGFNIIAYFNGWKPGDPFPTGAMALDTTGFPLLPSSVTQTFEAGPDGKPSVQVHFFFETGGSGTITVSYPGDALWKTGSAQITVNTFNCGGP